MSSFDVPFLRILFAQVTHTGFSHRVVLIVDFWHPDLVPSDYPAIVSQDGGRLSVVEAHRVGHPPEIDGPADHYQILAGAYSH